MDEKLENQFKSDVTYPPSKLGLVEMCVGVYDNDKQALASLSFRNLSRLLDWKLTWRSNIKGKLNQINVRIRQLY